ncbi:MAG: DUF1559 domain-containing protein, partial [Thermoguttaceae bacterium]
QALHDTTDAAVLAAKAITAYTCPTRRACAPFYWQGSPPSYAFHNDYAANSGSNSAFSWYIGPPSLAQADTIFNEAEVDPTSDPNHQFFKMQGANGVCHQRSVVALRDITDGTSNTYLVGEKLVRPEWYASPDMTANYSNLDCGDDQCATSGDCFDLVRWTDRLPRCDTPGYLDVASFGSAHANGLNMAFCDGSVQQVSYTIEATVHQYLGSRNDNVPINGK